MVDEFKQRTAFGKCQFLLCMENGNEPYAIYVCRSRKGTRSLLAC